MESFFHIIINFLAIYIFDIGKEAVAIHGLLGFMLAMYYHSNFKMPLNIEKIISIFFTTPKFHAPHHDRDIKNNQTNYSSIFTLWDKLFSTYNKSTFAKSWDFGLSYSSDVSTLQSLIKPLGKNGGK